MLSNKDMDHDMLEKILNGREKPTNLPFALLKNITENFSEERVIGRGGFGIVYKGVLQNGNVAVKRITNTHRIDEKFFYREVDSLLKVNHQNVVRFLGFCASTERAAVEVEGKREHIYAEVIERLLCFEYISNGSLQHHITDELRGLEWHTRYQIIKGISEGLLYLHKEQEMKHMDLKPDNVLLDNRMIPKITDFGLSRLDEKTQVTGAYRCGSLGYCAPEYVYHGRMSFKSDMYSLGVIIIEVVTGHKSIPHNSKVLRRWKHRWNKSAKETPLVCQQVTKCIEIGLLCQENDPRKRPFIWDMIHDINELDGTDGKISSTSGSMIGQISTYSEDDMLAIEPLELHFAFELNKQMSCSLQLTNETDSYIAFNIENMSPLSYSIQPQKGIVPQRSMRNIIITLQPQGKTRRVMQRANEFIVWSTKVNDDFTVEDITTDLFIEQTGNVVDEVNLDVVFDAQLQNEIHDVHLPEPRISFQPNKAFTGDVSLENKVYDSNANQNVLPHLLNKMAIACDQKMEKQLQDSNAPPEAFPLEFLKAITCDFSTEWELDRCVYGVDYKGVLQSGKIVVVKKLEQNVILDETIFQNQVIKFKGFNHQNIVQLLGYCAQSSWETVRLQDEETVLAEIPKRLLIYEYVCNKKLNNFIFDESLGPAWNIRYEIIKGICSGLHFLHEECRIAHMCLLPEHILMDATMIPKITGFWWSRIFDNNHSRAFTDNRIGSHGYMAPEYLTRGLITVKADIFSLGVIIIEIITGHRDYPCIPDDDPNTKGTATSCQHFTEKVLGNWRNKFESTPKCKSIEIYTQQVIQCITIALKCMDLDMEKRPLAKDIVEVLNAVDQMETNNELPSEMQCKDKSLVLDTSVSKELKLHKTEDMCNMKADGTVGGVKKSQECLLPKPLSTSSTNSQNHQEAAEESSDAQQAIDETSENRRYGISGLVNK